MRILITILMLFCTRFVANAQDPDQMIDKFFATFEKKDIRKAVDDLYATNKWNSRIADQLENVKSGLEKFTEEFMGKCYGRDLIVVKSMGQNLKMYSYLVKYDRQPLRFIFKFYRPNDKWTLFSFSYDGNLTTELEEAGKLYYQKLDSY